MRRLHHRQKSLQVPTEEPFAQGRSTEELYRVSISSVRLRTLRASSRGSVPRSVVCSE